MPHQIQSLFRVVIGLIALVAAPQVIASPDYDLKLCNNSPYSSSGCKDAMAYYVKSPEAKSHVKKDFKALKKSCKPGKSQSSACGVLAYAYANGVGVDQSDKKAAKYAKKGCPLKKKKKSKKRDDLLTCTYQFEKARQSGDTSTAYKYADRAYIIQSKEGKEDLLKWLIYDLKGKAGHIVQSGNFRKDCEKKLGLSCYAEALTWEKKYGWKKQLSTSRDRRLDVPGIYYQKGCDAGHGQSCFEFARGVKAGKVPGMAARDAGGLIARACTNGYQAACNSAEGQAAVTADYRGISPALPVNQQLLMADEAIKRGYTIQAVQTLQRLSAQNHKEARVRLGSIYLSGAKGIAPNRVKALQWFSQSKHPEGLYLAALMSAENGDNASYERYMTDAYFAGNEIAKTWYLARQKHQQNASAAAGQARAKQHAADKASQYQADRLNMQRAMGGYGQNAKEKRVCAMIYQGGRMTRECMSEDHFDRYFRP